ncbi:lactadherin-like [Amphiura filiformis]|uniref:lactadherin-like n=1 Tax=Amphiura filiformis TaxID=82378 RepID=UPI003B220525
MTSFQLRSTSLFVAIFVLRAVLQTTAQNTCQSKLGLEDGSIGDSQLTASTEYYDGVYHGAANARLNRIEQPGTTGAWSPLGSDGNQWIQAALGKPTWVTGVLTQGRHDCCPQWLTKFKVQYSDDGFYWTFVQQTNNQVEMIFDGNTDQNTVATNLFPTPVIASYIRIVPTAWNTNIGMRFELLGCGANICQDAAGVADGRIPDGQLKASSEFAHALYHGAANARLNRPVKTGTTGSWSAQTNDINQWIQAELTGEAWVTGVMIQGRVEAAQWVTKFKVQLSKDGNSWAYVQTPNTQTDMVFNGSTDQNRAVVVLFPFPVRASFVRIRPTAWNGHISMRFEVLACSC